jgi:hypothetical protein
VRPFGTLEIGIWEFANLHATGGSMNVGINSAKGLILSYQRFFAPVGLMQFAESIFINNVEIGRIA